MNESNSMMIPEEVIMSKIYLIRGLKVMLDKDLAELYGVTTGNLNKAVNRNLRRFPDDFMFRLSKQEFDNLIFQSGTSSWGGTRKIPKKILIIFEDLKQLEQTRQQREEQENRRRIGFRK